MHISSLADALALAGYAAAMEKNCLIRPEIERLAYGFESWAIQLVYFVEHVAKTEALEKAHAFLDRVLLP
jgi:hypothetical protein